MIDWNVSGVAFEATCEDCGARCEGGFILEHDCGPKPAEWWAARYRIEKRYARRVSWLLALALTALLAGGFAEALR